MSVFDTKHKRKSAAITAVILVILLYLIFNYGMRYLDPPVEYGIAINYGTSNVGKGEPKIVEKVKATSKQPFEEQEAKEEVVEEVIPEETIKEEVLTSNKKDAPFIEKPKKEEKKEKLKKEIKEEKPKSKTKKPSKTTLDAFDNLLKGDESDGKIKAEGDDTVDGLKGDKNGDPKSSKYYGNQGSDGGAPNYNLAERKALVKPKPTPDCQEDGLVYVKIRVDETGKVISAEAGVQGSTNTPPCLKNVAEKAAMNTVWTKSPDGKKNQIGIIIYDFKVTE